MKNVGVYIAIAAICAAGGAYAGNQTCSPEPGQDPLTAPPPPNMPFPSFCDIPPAPKSVPSAAAFKTDVVRVRVAGRNLDVGSGPDTWSLGGTTESFAAEAKREVEPPAPMTTPEPGGTEAFVEKSQAQTTPPPKHRRPRH